MSDLEYDWGVLGAQQFIDKELARGRATFSQKDGVRALGISRAVFSRAINRLVHKRRLASLVRGFYLILRPEDYDAGAPDPVRWLDPMMRHLGVDYRISLLRAAAFHGASHQAAMVFQVIVPRQLKSLEVGRHRIEFVYQSPRAFVRCNVPAWMTQIKSEAGFAKAAGIELTLLDAARYFHRVGGINGLAQIAKDLGDKASSRKLGLAAAIYENSSVRRLGYLLERFGHSRQAGALVPFAEKAKSMKPLDPSVKPSFVKGDQEVRNNQWRLIINETVEVDS